SSRRRHTRCLSDWSSDVCSSDLPFQDDITPVAVKFLRNFGPGNLQLAADKIDSRLDIGQMSRVSDDCFNRNVVCEDFVIGVEDQIGRASCRERVWSAEGAGVVRV